MKRTLLLPLSIAILLGACSSQPRLTPTERLELYRANSGEPVNSFVLTSRTWSWTALGDSALVIWTRRDQGYLIEFFTRCPDLAFASEISMSNRTSRVSAGFDSVMVRRAGARPGSRTPCRIDTIRPINTRVVEEPPDEAEEDVVWEERDPSVPDEPAVPTESR